MKIAIIEKEHFEVAYTLIRIFDNDDNTLTIFIDEKSFEQLVFLLQEKVNRYTWVIQKREPNRAFIKRLFEQISREDFDLLYFDTIADNFIHYAWHISKLRHPKIIMTLHDIMGFFHYSPSLSIRKTIRFLGKRKLIRVTPAFNVLSETLMPLLQQKLHYEKQVFNIPGALFEPEFFTIKRYSANEMINITIPGSVDIRRRNYESVFDFLERAKSAMIKVSVTLLGSFRKNHSESIRKKCIEYTQSNNNLLFYETDMVDQQEFNRVMNETHFIWMPLNQYAVVTDGTKEQYGISISTGNIGDAIRYAKPFFAPAFFMVDSALQKSCHRYKNIMEIIDKLQKLTNEDYTLFQNEALNGAGNYTKEKIIERNKILFE